MPSASSRTTSALGGKALVLLAEVIDFIALDLGVDTEVMGQVPT
jgi:hypothetical protein